ncbi:MAG TPA: hypothetical protein VGD37_14325 [Kofleriaceae bacterium]|jgi:hypothetical protein
MLRAALPAIGILGLTGVAGAEPLAVTMESGGEADSNVARVETVDQGTVQRIAAPAIRAGARIDSSDALAGGRYVLRLSGLARMVASSRTKTENVMLFAGEGRWLRPISSRPIAAGLHLAAADAFSITGGTGARTFRTLGADALLVLGREDQHLTLELGARDFWYKPAPAHVFDWRGPVANARLDLMLWQAPDRTRSLELATTLGVEARSYTSDAVANCAADMAAEPCSIPTALHRRDRYQRAGIELDWTGHVVVTGGYQATVINSNSFGQSLIRQRIMASLTMELPGKLLGTATATLQLDQYPDGVLLEKDVVHQEFTSLEDENRSSLQILLARRMSPSWSIEVRGAAWRDFANTGAASFRRELIYAGVIYQR